MKKKLIATMIACTMLMTCLPSASFADTVGEQGSQTSVEMQKDADDTKAPQDATETPRVATEPSAEPAARKRERRPFRNRHSLRVNGPRL